MLLTRARHVVCLLGGWSDFARVEEIVRAAPGFSFDREYSMLEPDDRMEDAFEASRDRVVPSMTEADFEAIAGHRAVAYVLSPPLAPDKAQEVSAAMLGLTAALLESGGVAAKSESAGIAHGRARWIELARAARASDRLERASALMAAWVRRPLDDEGMLYTCGMHLLGEPDVEVEDPASPEEAVEWMDLLGLYLLAEKPAAGIRAGEGFRRGADGPRKVMQLVTCERYESDDFFYNPHGYLRLTD